MRLLARLSALLICVSAVLPACAQSNPEWTTPLRPFRISDNLYYVGSRDLASYLVTTPAGGVLINSNLESSVSQIRHSVEQLGFQWSAIKILLISHAHFDHCAGSSAIVQQTGAKYMVMDGDVDAVESGGKTDPVYGGGKQQFPPAHVDRVLHDGDTVTLGGVVLTARKTPGHTRGNTTWTMDTRPTGQPNVKPLHVVIVGSWNVTSEMRLVPSGGRPASYPGIAEDFAHTFAVLRSLPCDIFLGAHGSYFGMITKLLRLPQEGESVWIDPEGYKLSVNERERGFQQALAKQKAAAGIS